MMGNTHAATAGAGFAGAVIVIQLVPLDLLPELNPATWIFAVVLATGAALLPDADCDSSTAYHALGPASRYPAEALQLVCRLVYNATRSTYDPPRPRVHRGLTHTITFATIVGGTTGLVAYINPWLITPLVFFCGVVTLQALHSSIPLRVRRVVYPDKRAITVLHVLYPALWAPTVIHLHHEWITSHSWFLAAVITSGIAAGAVGDGCTDNAVPLLWPIRIRGQRWKLIGIPRRWRITTGRDSRAEANIRRLSLRTTAALFLLTLVQYVLLTTGVSS